MDLIILPIVVSVFGAGLFIIPVAIGGVMTMRQATVPLGKTILVYSSFGSSLGLVCCWLAYAALRPVWSWDGLSIRLGNGHVLDLPMTLFCVSGPFGTLWMFMAGGLNGKSAAGGLIAAAGVALILAGVRLKRPHPGANPSADVSPPVDREPPDPDAVRTIVRRS